MGGVAGNARPIGSFFALGLLDRPETADSNWYIWYRNGGVAIREWTAWAALARLIRPQRRGVGWLRRVLRAIS